MRTRFFPALLFVFAPYFVFAQKQGYALIDSLRDELVTITGDSGKVDLLDRISYTFSNVNPDSGILYGNKALQLSQKINWQKGIAVSYADLGINYEAKSDHVAALEYEVKAMKIYEALGLKQGVAAMLANIALVYRVQSDYPKALEYSLRALKIAEDLGDKHRQAIILENIGTIYLEQKDYSRTEAYYSDAVSLYKTVGDMKGMARNITNMGIVYDAKGSYKKALDNHFTALAVNRQLGNTHGVQINLANIGIVYNHLGRLQDALKYQYEALAISRKAGDKSGMAVGLGNIGETHLAIAKEVLGRRGNDSVVMLTLRNAVEYLERAVAICKEINYLGPATEFVPNLSEAYFLSGDYKKAYESYRYYALIKDSIFSAQTLIQVTSMENKRQMDMKEKNLLLKDKQIRIAQLEIKQKRNERVLFLLGLALLVVVLAVSIKSIFNYRKSNRLLSREKKKQEYIILGQLRDIKTRNRILEEIAHVQAHDLRGHVATILGLSQLFNNEDYSDPANETVVKGIRSSAEQLDNVVRDIIKKQNELNRGE